MKFCRLLLFAALAVFMITGTGCLSTSPSATPGPAAEEIAPAPSPVSLPPSTPLPPPPAPAKKSPASYGKVSPYFTQNQGQLRNGDQVKFYIKGSKGTVYLTDREIVYDFLKEIPGPTPGEDEKKEGPPRDREEEAKKSYERLVFRLRFEGADPDVKVSGQKERGGKVNYFIGSKKNWHSNIPIFDEVLYQNIYPGVDLKFFLEGSNPRRIFTLKPGINPSVIRFGYRGGVDELSLNPEGGLSIQTRFGIFREKAPEAYQEINGEQVKRAASYQLEGEKDLILKIPDFDSRYPLIIK